MFGHNGRSDAKKISRTSILTILVSHGAKTMWFLHGMSRISLYYIIYVEVKQFQSIFYTKII
jgi:hypothetical protein